MKTKNSSTYYILALAVSIGLLFHGASFFHTLENTYDAYVHIFFADHYARSWFEPWENRWYTGFNLISYPPLLHQIIAMLSFIGGLKFATYLIAFLIIVLYVTGAYRFAKLIAVNDESAGYAALVAVFLPSVIEALHVFGQLPMMLGISWLLHALPEIYKYIRYGHFRYFLNGLSLIAVGVCSHHVTPIFGMVFFVLPLMGTAIMDSAKAEVGSYTAIGIKAFINHTKKSLGRIILFGLSTIIVTILVILPYWIWSKNDPITQIPIPHGSRDNFIEVFSSGLTFFILPWGFLLLILPYFFYRFYSKRNLFLGLSFTLLIILGTGGTTPIPRMLLGDNAFNILTLERFTFWATIYAMPLAGEFLWHFTKGNIYQMIMTHRSAMVHSIYVGILIFSVFLSAGFTMNLNFFRPLQPKSIDIKPIENFLGSDKHSDWRYLTLGFGDQMAWLSANTDALTIDGNYHSARRIPELTSRAIERLENSKYKGQEGIETLQQFLGSPEKFYLKYIFSNDKFYDPILYFNGWHRVKYLDNGIMAWERSDIPSLPSILPTKKIPFYQKMMWGIVPLLVLLIAIGTNLQLHWTHYVRQSQHLNDSYLNPEQPKSVIEPVFYHVTKYWIVSILTLTLILVGSLYALNLKQLGPERVVEAYYNEIDFKFFKKAHELLDPDARPSLDYFLLASSVTDGLIESYGKVNTINTAILERTDHWAKVATTIEWVTPLGNYKKEKSHEVVKKGLKWYIVPSIPKSYIPSDQFTDVSNNQFVNQGRRKISVAETFHEDVLDRPVAQVRHCQLVSREGSYYLIGQIQNLDNYPIDLTLKAKLIDSKGQLMANNEDNFNMAHKLLPKEVTSFRIDFDTEAWDIASDSCDREHLPSFVLNLLGMVATKDLYKNVALQGVSITDNRMKGHLYNFGDKTASISQFIISHFTAEDDLIWVESGSSEQSCYPQKSVEFDMLLNSRLPHKVAQNTKDVILINGIANDKLTTKYLSKSGHSYHDQIPKPDGGYIQVQLNNFIGNPAPY